MLILKEGFLGFKLVALWFGVLCVGGVGVVDVVGVGCALFNT